MKRDHIVTIVVGSKKEAVVTLDTKREKIVNKVINNKKLAEVNFPHISNEQYRYDEFMGVLRKYTKSDKDKRTDEVIEAIENDKFFYSIKPSLRINVHK